jgi:hypothetical protein
VLAFHIRQSDAPGGRISRRPEAALYRPRRTHAQREIIMNNQTKIFAFKLAAKQEKAATPKWKAREGVSLAGCTDPTGDGDFREFGHVRDGGIFC